MRAAHIQGRRCVHIALLVGEELRGSGKKEIMLKQEEKRMKLETQELMKDERWAAIN